MSLFPEIDEEIKQIKIKEKELISDLIDNSEMYRPTNSDDGFLFERNFCAKCSKDNEEKGIFCDVIGLLLGGDSEDVRKINDNVFCLKDSNFNIKDFVGQATFRYGRKKV